MKYGSFFLAIILLLLQTQLTAQRIPIAAIPDWVQKSVDFIDVDTTKRPQEKWLSSTVRIYQEIQINLDTEETFYKHTDKIIIERPSLQIGMGHSPKDVARKIIRVSSKKGDDIVNLTKKLNWGESTFNEYIVNKLWESYKEYYFTLDRVEQGDLVTISYLDQSLRNDYKMGDGLVYPFRDSSEIYFRLISSEPLQVKTFNGFPKVEVVRHATYFEYLAKGLAVTPYKGSTPPDFIPAPTICFSKFTKIEEVGYLFKDLFLADERSAAALDQLYAKLTQDVSNDSIKIKNIVNYVQDTILYQDYGLIKSYQPYWSILGNRGDCKAKSLIAIELLKRAGVEAYPVLVNSRGYPDQLDSIPSVANFDHVITQFILGADTILVDPTGTGQTDKIGGYPVPDFQKGLVMYGDQAKLIELAAQNIGKIEVYDTIADRVQRKLVLSGVAALRYDKQEVYSSSPESLFRSSFFKLGAKNPAIHALPEFAFSGAIVSELEKNFYNSISQDSIVLSQEMYFPDSIQASFLPTEKCEVNHVFSSSGIFGSQISSIDSTYTGNWPLEYVNQTTSAVYDKEKIGLEAIHLDTIDTHYSIETTFGHYRCTITENESYITVKQDILVSGELPFHRKQEYEDFEIAMKKHASKIYHLFIAKKQEENALSKA